MNYINCDIPRNLNEFIGMTTQRLKSQLSVGLAAGYKSPHSVNLLWNNYILGAEFHFSPWKNDSEVYNIAGVESGYFHKLMEYAPLPVPTEEDLVFLAEYGNNSPHVIAALGKYSFDICAAIKIDYTGIRPLLRNLLSIFCDCVRLRGESQTKAFDKIKELDRIKLLDKVIHILLTIIPQYSFAKGQCLLEKDEERWIKPDDKKDKWGEVKDSIDPATSMYVLLSVIESLQWQSMDHFYAIPNLLSFITRKVEDETIKQNLQQYALSLSQLSMYLTAPEMSIEQKRKLTDTLKSNLIYGISQLCDLVRAVNMSYFKHSLEICTEFPNWFSQRLSRGLLGISNAEEVTYYQEFLSGAKDIKAINGRIKKRSAKDLNSYIGESKVSEIAKLFISPWGLYLKGNDVISKPLPSEISSYALSYQYNDAFFKFSSQNKGISTCITCSLDKSNQLFQDAVHNSRSCVSHLLNDIVSISRSHRLLNKDDWYKQAFGTFYYHYDKIRHDKLDTTDFKIRKSKEARYYLDLIFPLLNQNSGNINILDIGIGYGRLEKNLLEEAQKLNRLNMFEEKAIFWGLDISVEMKKYHAKHLQRQSLKNRYRIGEMAEVCDIFKDSFFDMIILAFTTFGCYSSDEENLFALKQIIKALRPGGILVIEQFNPEIREPQKPYWIAPNIIEDRYIQLIKTTQFVPVSDLCTLYTGEYIYSENTMRGLRVIRRDDYCVRLYRPQWFKEIMISNGFDPSNIYFKSDFTTEDYIGNKDEQLMICVAKKKHNVLNDNQMKQLIKLGWGILIDVKDENNEFEENLQIAATKLYKSNLAVYTENFQGLVLNAKEKFITEENFNAITSARNMIGQSPDKKSASLNMEINKVIDIMRIVLNTEQINGK